jgi:exopolysaccharide production protein ExoZ
VIVSEAKPAALRAEPAPLANAERRRLDFIDALRGFACLWVLLHHSFESVPVSGKWEHLPLDLFLHFSRIGWLGVSLFLVLSGFCLYYPLVRKHSPAAVKLDVAAFVRRRALRILPPYFAALVLFTVMAWWAHARSLPWPETVGWKDVASHALMLHNLSPSTFASINPAFWSLALEVQLYVVFPILVWLAARHGLRMMLLTTFACALLWQGAAFAHFGLSMTWGADLARMYHALPARCFEFAAGMCAAAFVAAPRAGQAPRAGWIVALLALPALWFVSSVSRFGPLFDQVWGIIFASLVVLLARAPALAFENVMPLRTLVSLGTISYSVYLIHQPLIGMLAPEQFSIEVTGRVSFLGFGLLRLAVIVLLGLGFFALLEKPFIARAGRLSPAPMPLPARR